MPSSTVRNAQSALSDKGYSVGAIDGHWGTQTMSAVRRFQEDKGLAPSGTLDSATLTALGVSN
jgi:peptidoglycan hydrolase-like protein with peptidoglycan-binding domain